MGGITLMQIVDRMAALIAADADLSAWCVAHYKQPVILVGLDERNRPGEDQCPLILIRPASVSEDSEYISFTVQLDWAVHDDAVTASGSVTEYTGVRRVDELGQLVWLALDALPSTLQLLRSEYTLETVERFPLCLGGMDITINVPRMLSGRITL